MKKTITILLSILLIAAISITATAAGRHHFAKNENCNNGNYVDTDNDGVCDNRNENCGNGNYVDTDNDGVCDNKNENCGNGNYVDTDNDGVCDNKNENCKNQNNACGGAKHQRHRNHH